MKKLLALLLATLMLLSMGIVAATAEGIGDVKILTNVTGGKDEAEMTLFAQELSKLVDGNVTMEKPASNYGDVLMQKLNAGEQYDLIYISIDQLYSLQEQGALTDLTDMIAASAILGDAEVVPTEEWDQLKVADRIWGAFNKTEVHKLPIINKVLAAKAGVDPDAIVPTLEGYYQAFTAMKGVGGDGFYPFSTHIKGLHDLQPWFSSVGIKCGLVKKDDGTITMPVASEASIPVWEWMAKLYAEGLLDPDCLTNETKDMRNKFNTGLTGLVVDWAAWCGLYNVNVKELYPAQYEAYPLPGTKAEGGDYMLARGNPSIWAIPVNAANPEGAFKILEFFATQEGGQLLSIGIEGNDWTREGDKITLTETGIAHAKDHGAPVPTSRKYVNPVEWNPGFEKAMEYLPYAGIELTDINTAKARDIVAKYATQIINGTMTATDGVAAMQGELKDLGIVM